MRPDNAGPLPGATFPDGVLVAPYRLGDADDDVHRLIYVDAAWAAVAGHAERDLALDVEAHNESALGLYRSVGMQIEREWRFCATVA